MTGIIVLAAFVLLCIVFAAVMDRFLRLRAATTTVPAAPPEAAPTPEPNLPLSDNMREAIWNDVSASLEERDRRRCDRETSARLWHSLHERRVDVFFSDPDMLMPHVLEVDR